MTDTINDTINKTNITSDFIKLGVSKSVCDVVIQLVFYGMDCSDTIINRSARYISCDINNNAVGGGTEFTLKFKMPIPDNREISYYFHFSDDYVVDVVKSTYI